MHVGDELRELLIRINQTLREFARMARRIANALNPLNLAHVFEKERKVRLIAGRRPSAVGIHVLSEKRHFLHALVSKLSDFNENVDQRTRNFFASRIGNDAVSAVLGASFHNRNEGRGSARMRSGQRIKLFDFREAHVDLRAAGFFPFS